VLDGIGTRDELASIACAECLLEGADRGAALAFMRDEMRAHPDWTWLRTALGTQLLAAGDWQEGWALYLSRPFRPQSEELRHATLDALNGKRILLQGEQGIGDVLFFLRFAPQLAEVAASLTLACKRKLVPLLAAGAAASGMKVIADEAQEAGAWDVHLALGDLPACLPAARTPPAWPVAVESSAREEWGRRLAALGPPPYLGVTWRAGTDVLRRREFGNNRNLLMKEVPAARMGAALRGWRGTVLALQRGLRDGELAAFAAAAQAPAHDLAALGDDLPALAAVLSLLDEYAAVSNTNIHILAGLGRTARVLVPYPPEWRWMREGASPWFPGCGVYREPQSRGWTEPLAQLRRDLIG
jgi:hypothetical protein